MSNFCPQIAQCGWCNPCCTERIKMNSLMKLEKDWLEYGKNSRTIVTDDWRTNERRIKNEY